MEIYLIRHTTPAVEKGICYGQTDIALNEVLFAEEIKVIQSKIPDNVEHFFTSPLQRCKKLTEQLNENYTEDIRLIEFNFGDWENKNWNEINQEQLNFWMNDFVNVLTPNGENYKNLHQRTSGFIEELLETAHHKTAIVTHAGNIRSFISWVLDLPLENSFRIELAYGAVIALQINKNKSFNKLISIK